MQGRLLFTCSTFFTFIGLSVAQESKAPTMVHPISCGVHGDVEVSCGTRRPEDIELTPDGKYLIATQFLDEHPTSPVGGGMELFDLKKKTFTRMIIEDAPDKTWGDPACPDPIGDALVSHGESLAKRKDGRWALYVVNHGRRESIEMFELKPTAANWELVWHGCELGAHAYNDVAILPDGGFVGTQPLAFIPKGGRITLDSGITGYVALWKPGAGESEIPGTRMRFPNGVVVSADGNDMFVNEFLGHHVLKFDLKAGKQTGTVTVDFLPDNLTWTQHGHLLSAGMKGVASSECPKGSGKPCNLSFGIVEIDPATMQLRTTYDSENHDLLVEGVTVALKVGQDIYLGTHVSDRLVKLPGLQ